MYKVNAVHEYSDIFLGAGQDLANLVGIQFEGIIK